MHFCTILYDSCVMVKSTTVAIKISFLSCLRAEIKPAWGTPLCTRFVLIHGYESTFWWFQKYFVWLEIYCFLKRARTIKYNKCVMG